MEERVKDLRSRLNKIIVMELLSVRKASKEIGIHAIALDDFLYDKTKPHIVTLSKIERYLDKAEGKRYLDKAEGN